MNDRYANMSSCEWLNKKNKPVGELVCALCGFPRTVTICDKWHHRPHDHKFRNICCPEIWSFEIFQNGGRPNLAFGTMGSRSIQSAVPENPTVVSNAKSIGWPVAEIWPFEIFQDGGQPPSRWRPAAILDFVKPEVGPVDPPSPKTLP